MKKYKALTYGQLTYKTAKNHNIKQHKKYQEMKETSDTATKYK